MLRKHSATLHGHRTSFTLEDAFWDALRNIAATREIPLARLIAEVDDSRSDGSNLSSALRVFVLDAVRSQGRAQSQDLARLQDSGNTSPA
jgi:predicted DNA-binding ribbon-helix-helix protein